MSEVVSNITNITEKIVIKEGVMGEHGLSAYQIWLAQGNVGTEKDYLDSLSKPSLDLANEVLTEIINNNVAPSPEVIISRTNKIGNTYMNLKERLDTEYNEVKTQLAEKANKEDVRLKSVKNELEDMSSTVLAAIEGGTGTSFNLLSIPQDKSVTPSKTTFLKPGKNLFNKNTISPQGQWVSYESGEKEVYPDNPYVSLLHWSDYISVDSGKSYIANVESGVGSYVFFDKEKKFIGGTVPKPDRVVVMPVNCHYVIINVRIEVLDILQFEVGATSSAYEEYQLEIPSLEINKKIAKLEASLTSDKALLNLPDKSVTPIKTSFMIPSKNLFNKRTVSPKGEWISYVDGVKEVYPDNQYIASSHYSDFIVVIPNTKYIANQPSGVGSYVFYDSEKNFIGGTAPNVDRTITTPSNCSYLIINFQTELLDALPSQFLQFEVGEVSTEYEEYHLEIPDLKLNKSVNQVKLNLPVKYDLVCGDTFELFYRGIILANNPYNYNIKIQCSKGQQFAKRYIFTPTGSDIGTHVMTISIYDDNEQLLDSKTVNLVVKAKAENPSTIKNVLNIGDSLTVGGQWVTEAYSRLVLQNGLTNLNFIGTVGSTPKYEGYGGWTYDNYLSNVIDSSKVWVVGTHNKDQTDQWSIYKDTNGTEWKLETIENMKIKVIRTTGTSSIPSSGTLTWVSGGTHTGSITYTSTTLESGNPFWNENTNSVDFANYASELGVTSIDYVNILLGWNSTNDDEATYKGKIRSFINLIRTSFPNAKIALLGLQIPSLDGLGTNYGTTWNFYEKLKFVFNLDKWHKDICGEYTGVDYINISGQFDTENNTMLGERPVNVRNNKLETYGTNGVHPANEGYLQIADAVYRSMNNKI